MQKITSQNATGILLIAEQVLRTVSAFLVSVLIARLYGAGAFGTFAFALTVVAVVQAISKFGLDQLIIKQISEGNSNVITFSEILFLRFALSGLVALLIGFYLTTTEAEEGKTLIILLVACLLHWWDVIDLKFQADRRAGIGVSIRIALNLLFTATRITLIINQQNIEKIAATYVLENLLHLVAFALAERRVRRSSKIDKEAMDAEPGGLRINKILVFVWMGRYFGLAAIISILYTRLDAFAVTKYLPPEQVGIYLAATRIAEAWLIVPTAMAAAILPIAARQQYRGPDFLNTQWKLFRNILRVTMGAALLIILSADHIISIVYGSKFIEAADILRVQSLSLVFTSLGVARASWITVGDLGKLSVMYLGAGCLINLVATSQLTPTFGAIGAAWSSCIAQIMSSVILPLMFPQTREIVKLAIMACFEKTERLGK